MSEHGSLCAQPVDAGNGLPKSSPLLRAKQIAGPILPIGLSTWWQWVKDGKAPRGIKISSRITVWKKDDVLALVDRLANGEAE